MNAKKNQAARWSLLFCLGSLAAACTVGPNYKTPTTDVPAAFKEQPPAGVAPGDWKPAQPSDSMRRGKWWEIFGDANLNALEEQVSVSNQSLAQAEAQFRGARAAVREARAGLFPTVTAGASVTNSRSGAGRSSAPAAVGSGSGTTTVYQTPIDVSYEADVWGRVRRLIEANAATAQASAADVETMRLSLQAELAADWFQLHGLDQQRQLLDTTIAAYQKTLQINVNRHNQGVASGADVAQAETQLETTRAQAIDLGVARAELEHAIAILTGKPPAELTIAVAPLGVSPPAIPLELPGELLQRRPDIAAAERRVAAANAQIGVATAAYFPSLTLSASGGFASSTLATLFSLPNRFWSIGPQLLATVFDAGRRRAVTAQAQATYDANVAAYRESVLTAFQNVEDNLAALRILSDEATQQAAAVAAAERSLTLAQNRYDGGITSYLEVVTAEAAALANERTAVDIASRRLIASVNLVKALGGGWNASDLPVAGSLVSR
jgi:NodT family efflux transporter outer membrane factor (OMF) lipoprotein